jgi:uncharacterized protein
MKHPRSRLASLACLGIALSFGPTLRAEEGLPLLRSVLIDGQAPMFSLADATGAGRWLKIGESFEGWKLESFDATKQVLIVSRDGEKRELGLEVAKLKDEAGKATLAEAETVLQKMRFEEMIGKALEAQQKAMAKSMGGMMGKDLPPDEAAKMAAFQQKVMAAMFEEMDLPGMRQDIAKVYAEAFSSAELKAQADFYSTPAGQAMIDQQPFIQQRMTELMMPRMMKAMPKIQAMGQEFAKEQKAAAAAKAASPAPAANPAP